jgi:hypothetical protein
MQSFIGSFSIIIVSLLAGYAFNALIAGGLIRLSVDQTTRLRLAMQKTALLGVYPIAFLGAIWIADLSEPLYFILPFVGISALAIGLVYGLVVSRLLHLPPLRAGVFAISASSTNLGAIGALVAFILLGEPGFALVPFYKLLEELWNYSVLFPIARAYGDRGNLGSKSTKGLSSAAGFVKVLRDPFLLVALSAVSLGLVMNFTAISRPYFYTGLNRLLVPTGTTLLLFSIGMRLRFTVARADLQAGLLIVLGKSVIIPAVVSAIALALGLGQTPGGLGLKLVLVLSAMPVAFVSLVPPTLYKLDQDLAGSIWLVSNAALLVIAPALALILRI